MLGRRWGLRSSQERRSASAWGTGWRGRLPCSPPGRARIREPMPQGVTSQRRWSVRHVGPFAGRLPRIDSRTNRIEVEAQRSVAAGESRPEPRTRQATVERELKRSPSRAMRPRSAEPKVTSAGAIVLVTHDEGALPALEPDRVLVLLVAFECVRRLSVQREHPEVVVEPETRDGPRCRTRMRTASYGLRSGGTGSGWSLTGCQEHSIGP